MSAGKRAVYVQLLGRARAKVGPDWQDFAPDKRYRLLSYLACSEGRVSRDRLAYLFWPDITTHEAKRNLRQLLMRIRSLSWLSGIETEHHSLRWPVASDVAAFKRALGEDKLDEALALYGGSLLRGLDSYEDSEFENWLELAREQLYSSWRGTVMRRARELSELAQHERAGALFRLLLAQDALDEEALNAYMAAARAGEREQALLAYRAFSQRLRKELALEPTSTTKRLAQALQGERGETRVSLVPAPDAAPASLPLPPTSFVGRDAELAEIAGLLSKPECRLLTLAGPGGVGKTRIALQAARELAQRFEGGVTFVSLAALDSPEAIPTSLAQALGVDLRGHDALGQVTAYLKERHTLLVLDNFERLVEGAAVVSELVRGCPHLKLLVTSRERLNVEEEWLLPVAGLAFPKRTGVGVASSLPAATLEARLKGQAYEAVRLFVARAERMQPHFVLDDEALPHVLAICRSVEGLPLGLELAAAWVRTMPVADIAQEMAQTPDFLSTGARNVPDRQKSIRATFEYSWKLLAPKEQEVFRKLSVCRGGFRREAAAVVAGAPVAVLAALADKSLLQVAPAGRYGRHPLLYRYAQEKLAEHPAEEARTEAKHSAYYLRSLQAWAGELRGANEKQALEDIAQEIGNIRVAWDWAVARCKVEDVLACLPGLADFYELQCWFEEGMEALRRAALAFAGEGSRSAALLGKLLARQGRFAWHLGRYREARGLLEASLHRGGPSRGEGRAYALNELATVAYLQGNFAEAKALCHDSLRLYQELAQPRGVARVLSNLAIVAFAQGSYREAKALHQESLALRRQLGDALAIAYTLANLGDTAYVLGEYQEAKALIGESLAIRRASGHRRGIADALNLLGKVTQALGEHSGALALQRESLAIRQEIGDRWGIGRTLDSIGTVLLALGERQAAKRHFREALKSAMKIEATPQAVEVLVSMAQLLAHEGEGERAVAVLAFALHHEAGIGEIKGRAKRLLFELEPRLSATSFAKAVEEGKHKRLQEVVEGLLAQA